MNTVCWAAGLLLAAPVYGRCAGRVDLEAAFLASFGQLPPVVRTLPWRIYDTADPPKLIETRSVILDVRPERLVPLGGRRYALVSFETKRSGGHSDAGQIAISYLDRTADHWRLKQLWPELLYSGSFGQPANVGSEVHRFGGDLLFMARSNWCGVGECSEWIGVIRLSRVRPIAYGDVLAGATSPLPGNPVLTYEGDTCQNYNVSAEVEPPRANGTLFSVRYDGWTAAPGTLSPKTPMHLFTSYVAEGSKLVMKPAVPVPTCGR